MYVKDLFCYLNLVILQKFAKCEFTLNLIECAHLANFKLPFGQLKASSNGDKTKRSNKRHLICDVESSWKRWLGCWLLGFNIIFGCGQNIVQKWPRWQYPWPIKTKPPLRVANGVNRRKLRPKPYYAKDFMRQLTMREWHLTKAYCFGWCTQQRFKMYHEKDLPNCTLQLLAWIVAYSGMRRRRLQMNLRVIVSLRAPHWGWY